MDIGARIRSWRFHTAVYDQSFFKQRKKSFDERAEKVRGVMIPLVILHFSTPYPSLYLDSIWARYFLKHQKMPGIFLILW